MDDRHAAQVRRGQEPGRVAQRTAADGDQRLAPLDPQARELTRGGLDDGQSLGILALRQEDPLGRPAGSGQAVREHLAHGRPGPGLGDEDRAPSRQALEGIDDGVSGDPIAEDEAADRRLRVEERGPAGRDRRRELLEAAVERLDDAVHLGHARAPDGRRRIEPFALAREVADGPDRVASRHEWTGVGRPAQPLGEDLRPSIQPDRGAAPVEAPAVARIDDRAAAGRHDPPDRRVGIGVAKVRHGSPLERPEGRLAILGEDLRDRPARGRFDPLVEIDEGRPMTLGQALADHALAAAGQTDQDDVHGRPSRRRRSRLRPCRSGRAPRGRRACSRWRFGPAVAGRRPPATGASGARAIRAR